MTVRYRPRGVCSQLMELELEDGIITSVNVIGGCEGNLQGLSRLLTGMPAIEAANRLKGIRCGMKPTSCPDQLSKAILQAIEE